MPTITIHIIDEHNGGIAVLTSAGQPIPGERLTPAKSLALDLLTAAGARAERIVYWHKRDEAMALGQDLLSPEMYGWAVSQEVHNAARRVLGIPRVGGN